VSRSNSISVTDFGGPTRRLWHNKFAGRSLLLGRVSAEGPRGWLVPLVGFGVHGCRIRVRRSISAMPTKPQESFLCGDVRASSRGRPLAVRLVSGDLRDDADGVSADSGEPVVARPLARVICEHNRRIMGV
jgi:hypothetical protein